VPTREAAEGQVGARQAFWFGLTDDMCDLEHGTMPIPEGLAKSKSEHRVADVR
jgi:hypothetical protein